MDIIAYGAASKEKRRAEELAALLGADVKGGKENLQGRLDTLMDSMDDVTRLADRVIVRDSVNLMKAEARLNTIVQAKKYGMDHMVFDDLLDLSGIDTLNSTGYTHDAVKGEIKGGVIFTKRADANPAIQKIILVGEEKKEADMKGVMLNGSSDYIQIPYDTRLKPTDSFSIEVKAEADWSALTKVCYIYSCTESGGYALQLNGGTVGSGNLGFIARIGSSYESVKVSRSTLNGAHTFRVEMSGGFLKFFVDGVLKDQKAVSGPVSYGFQNSLIIGAESNGTTGVEGFYFPGKLWHLQLKTGAGFESYFGFDEGAGSTTVDVKSGVVANLKGSTQWFGLDSVEQSLEEGDIIYYLSTNDEKQWVEIKKDELIHLSEKTIDEMTGIYIKVEMKENVVLKNYGLIWT